MTPIIQTTEVSKFYQSQSGVVKAVDGVSLEVNPGEFVALVGPSGSGKTTMLAMLAALLKPSQGLVAIDNKDLGKMKENDRVRFRRERIGFTFQANNLVPYLTVQENIEMMLRLNGRLNGEGKDRVQELIKRLGLEERKGNLPNQLSGGQRQRVAIARSLIHNPSVVLADEPTASLDSERAYQVVKIFADLIHEEQKAGIMVTHDLRLCIFVDKVYQMMDGKIERVLNSREEIDDFIACA